MKRAYMDIAEGQIHYRTEGKGESILLLHQTPLSSDEYLDIIPLLGKQFHVVAMDTMGYGASEMPPQRYEVADYVRSITNFLDAMNINKVNVVGNHTGAALAVELAVINPKRVNKLILYGCPFIGPEERKENLSAKNSRDMNIKEDGSHLTIWWEDRRKRSSYMEPEQWQRILANCLHAKLGTRIDDTRTAIYRYDIEARLPLIKNYTLLIAGTKDVFFNRLEATRKLIPKCKTMIIAGTHSHPAWEKPEEFSQVIINFLEDTD